MRKKLFTFLLALVTSVGVSWAVPTEFANCYDCWRAPEYPTNSGQCRLYNFGNPYVGNNNPSGPWKLEFVGNYDSSSSEYDSNIVKSYAASEYGKSPEQMEVYRLYQWQNGAYQPVAYGVLYAYANENNQVEHAAFFEAGGHYGCYLTGNTHSGGDDFNITFNEDASTGFADLHGSTPTPTSSGDKLSGVFSISSDKAVNFSKGNLQYVGGNWKFADNQWDVIGASQADNNRDLFGWGTGNNPNQTSMQYGDYSTFADWGTNMGAGWRTLTYDEWSYIFYTRTSASDLRGSATVCGVHGYIILPDNFVLPGGLSWTPRPDDWTTNVYTSQEWSSMEENGAVFLPVTGYRAGTTVIYDESSWGYYWSATEHSQAYNAYNVWVAGEDANVKVFYRSRTFGQSVRLVSETAPTPTSAGLQVTKLEIPDSWQNDPTLVTISDLPGFVAVSLEEAGAWDAVPAGDVVLIYAGTNEGVTATYFHNGAWGNPVPFGGFSRADIFEWASGSKIFYTSGGSTPAVDPAVQNVIDLINAIPNPVVYTQECYNALDAVYEAYRVLSPEQKDQVTNYNDYLEAESTYYMLGSVNGVIETINEIGNVEFTSACKHKIDYARSEYCNLTLEAKGYVTNYNTLLAAEAAYAALIPVSSTVEWDEASLETIDADEWNVATYTNGSISLKAVDGRAHYVDIDDHFIFDGMNSEKSFVFSCTSANILCIEITVSEKHEHNELSCAWQETATGYRWVGEATSVDLASTIFKVTGIRFSLGEAFPEPTPTPAQDGDKLPGAFTVDGGKVVYFSKGNLQYLGNIERWHFAENQWTIIGNAQASNNRDHFSWGTGDNPDSDDYSTYTEWGNNIEGDWRTLTNEDWIYLFNGRTDASSRYGHATVAGVHGVILLPDVYEGTTINSEHSGWENNVISSSEWAAYEENGAVFLPAAGSSDAYGVYGVNEAGQYWASTPNPDGSYAYEIFFQDWFVDTNSEFQRPNRLSVRLVSETAPTPAPSIPEVGMKGSWDDWAAVVNFTDNGDGTASVTKTFEHEGYYTFKTVLDGDDWRGNGYTYKRSYTGAEGITENGGDMTFWVDAKGEYTFTWTYASNAINLTYPTLPTIQTKGAWDDWAVALNFTNNGDGTASATKNFTETGYFNFKINVGTNDWRGKITTLRRDYTEEAWFNSDEGNITIYVDVTGDHTFTWTYVENKLSIAFPAVVIGDPNDASQVETFLTTYDGHTVPELTIDRPVKNNMYNTLCLPFHMDADQIANSSLNGVEIYEFTDADVVNDELYLYTSEQKHEIVAGRPYLVKYSAASQLDDLDFVNVVVNNADLDAQKVVINGVTFKGTFAPYWMEAQSDLNLHGGYLFLGQNNTLYWPNVSNYIKPFRAYFYVNVNDAPAGMPMRRGMPAHIGGPAQIPTGVGQVSQEPRANSQKVMENGVLYIIKNDVKYNVQGQIVK